MTYRGQEIGIPTLELLQQHIDEKGYNLSAKKIYEKCSKRKWLTKQGTPIKTLECLVGAYNGIGCYKAITNKDRKRKRKNNLNELRELMKKCPAKEDNHDTYIIYKEQMKDERWLAFRKFVLAVRGERCECCNRTTHLQIHHLQYQKKRLAWEYTVNDVRVLCMDCHKKVHNIV